MLGEDGMLEADEAARVEIALRALPSIERRVMAMSRLEGLSHRTIARRLDLGEDEVRALLFTSLRRLARAISHPGD